VFIKKPPFDFRNSLLVLYKTQVLLNEAEFIGTIHNTAFFAPLDCNYSKLIFRIEAMAKKLGANLEVIESDIKLKNPSDCHIIKILLYNLRAIQVIEMCIPAKLCHPFRLKVCQY